MTPITILTWLSSVLAVSAAITACIAVRRGSVAHLSRQYSTLLEAFDALKLTLNAQEAALMNLRARVTMQATREKRRALPGSVESSPQLDASPSADDDKARVRRELSARLANGQIKTPGR